MGELMRATGFPSPALPPSSLLSSHVSYVIDRLIALVFARTL